jgi:hypothetical protein
MTREDFRELDNRGTRAAKCRMFRARKHKIVVDIAQTFDSERNVFRQYYIAVAANAPAALFAHAWDLRSARFDTPEQAMDAVITLFATHNL